MIITNVILGLQTILLILLIIILIRTRIINEEQFILANTLLKNVCDIYYESSLKVKIDKLKIQYDLKPESKTNSINAFNDALNKLLGESAKQIVKYYISKKCLKTLLAYYDMNSVVLTIIFYLKR